MKNVKLYTLLLLILSSYISVIGQNNNYRVVSADTLPADSTVEQPIKKTRNVFGFIPNKKTKQINGLAFGFCLNAHDSMKVNGLDIEVLGGWFASPQLSDNKTQFSDTAKMNREYYKKYIQVVNGIALASLGVFNNGQVNGLAISFLHNYANEINGMSVTMLINGNQFFNGVEVALFNNVASRGRGLQIAAINTCYDFRGIQIGLWNKNGKRSLPFINWQFRP
jgi:hypothetical protein